MAVNYYQSQDSYGQPLLDQSYYPTDNSGGFSTGYPSGYTDATGVDARCLAIILFLSTVSEQSSGIGIAVCVFVIIAIALAAIFLVLVLWFNNTDVVDDANVKSKATFSDLGAASSASKTPVTAPSQPMTPARPAPPTSVPVATTASPTPPPPTPPTPAPTRPTPGPTRLPPDGYCDILIYTHVRFFNDTLHPLINEIGFETVKVACASYARTTCGLSLDVRYNPRPTFASIPFEEYVNELKAKFHMDHYGILNVYGQKDFVDNVSASSVPQTLSALRRILGEGQEREKHKVFVGVGYRYLNETNAWASLAYTAANLASKDVDIVVIITSFLMPHGRRDCLTFPVNAMKSPNQYTPALDDASNMAKEGFATPSTIVAFTFQMGVPYYVLPDQYIRIIDAMYEPCHVFGLTDYSQASRHFSRACQARTIDLSLEKAVIGLNKVESAKLFNKTIFQSHDTLAFMKEKAEVIMSRPDTRVNFTWLLWNVHLTDFTHLCLPGGPFERVKGFRDFFHQQAQLPKG
ncbi:hypothetical protein MTO96_007116 [Rhipicephalus appendiculatus]